MRSSRYTIAFYRGVAEAARNSAREVVPILMELVGPTSVIDVGAGSGAWLAAFEQCGAQDVVGIDIDRVPGDELEIPADRFLVRDLTLPLRLDRLFDLALSLEVGEHLPDSAAAGFISSLVALAPVVAFSAAIPAQGGTHHVNEQWPEYWAAHFENHGYVAVDCLRKRIWRNPAVAFWYAQNMLVYVDESKLSRYPSLAAEREAQGRDRPLSLVHPAMYEKRALQIGPRATLTTLIRALQWRMSQP
ncbi:MAG: class I SAM-dependent methyltransferase [Gaiellaceae bacterium]